jgi:hypothetical protein
MTWIEPITFVSSWWRICIIAGLFGSAERAVSGVVDDDVDATELEGSAR